MSQYPSSIASQPQPALPFAVTSLNSSSSRRNARIVCSTFFFLITPQCTRACVFHSNWIIRSSVVAFCNRTRIIVRRISRFPGVDTFRLLFSMGSRPAPQESRPTNQEFLFPRKNRRSRQWVLRRNSFHVYRLSKRNFEILFLMFWVPFTN